MLQKYLHLKKLYRIFANLKLILYGTSYEVEILLGIPKDRREVRQALPDPTFYTDCDHFHILLTVAAKKFLFFSGRIVKNKFFKKVIFS